ncbi:MAG: methyltransferase domain-containing protein [Nibricoccus sp.]
MANMDSTTYYQKVAGYFDRDAPDFEERYWKNIVLQRIRQSFREEVKAHSFSNVLEIGCGTGLDVAHFGSIFPARKVYGIDIAPEMVARAWRKIETMGLENVTLEIGTPESLETLFPDVQFDHIYVFFGALNTVPDLRRVAGILKSRMNPEGTMVLTFVNKWYLADMLIDLLKFRFKRAFKRIRKIWGGYAETKPLESRCYSPREIASAFGNDFEITRRRGYSILYPAWYRLNLIFRLGRRITDFLWKIDQVLNRTPAWCLGEYALYCFKTKEAIVPGPSKDSC